MCPGTRMALGWHRNSFRAVWALTELLMTDYGGLHLNAPALLTHDSSNTGIGGINEGGLPGASSHWKRLLRTPQSEGTGGGTATSSSSPHRVQMSLMPI